jgi:hypothetical protein
VITFDWENVSVESLAALGRSTRIAPPLAALAASQDRLVRKALFERLDIPTTRYAAVDSRAALQRAVAKIGLPGVLKTRRMGYDGKGQAVLRSAADLDAAWAAMNGQDAIYEEFVPFDYEVSIIGARSTRGEVAIYPLNHNVHRDGILRITRSPGRQTGAAAARGGAPAQGARALRLRRHPQHRVLRAPRPAGRERDGAAGAQLRPLDHRRRRDQPVREPPARHPRPAARQHGGTRPCGDGQPDRHDARSRERCSRSLACTCTTTPSRRAPAASSATAPGGPDRGRARARCQTAAADRRPLSTSPVRPAPERPAPHSNGEMCFEFNNLT